MKLNASKRNAMPKSNFGLPSQRKYPMPDKVHARIAKSYASKEFNAGKLSGSEKAGIDAKANHVLGTGTIHHKPGCGGNHLGAC